MGTNTVAQTAAGSLHRGDVAIPDGVPGMDGHFGTLGFCGGYGRNAGVSPLATEAASVEMTHLVVGDSVVRALREFPHMR